MFRCQSVVSARELALKLVQPRRCHCKIGLLRARFDARADTDDDFCPEIGSTAFYRMGQPDDSKCVRTLQRVPRLRQTPSGVTQEEFSQFGGEVHGSALEAVELGQHGGVDRAIEVWRGL